MKSAVTLSLVPQARGGPFVFWDGLADACRRAAELGFDALEIFPPSARALDAAQLQDLLARYRLRVAAVGTGAGWVVHKWSLSHPDAATRSRAREFIGEIIELAGAFAAPAIVGSIQGRCEDGIAREQAMAWLGEALEQLAADAARRNQALLFEPLNRYETNLLNRVGDAARFLEKIPARNVRIVADLFHMNIEESSICDALRDCGALLGHVHFADSNRRAVGMGHTDMGPILKSLQQLGYDGYLSAEVLPWPDGDGAARQTIESFRRHAG